jgi:hypothetical protein
VLGYVIPGEIVAASTSALVVATVYLAVTLARMRERISRLEEWVRQSERRNHIDQGGKL